ncbi:hypothetical protein HYC85_011671 [Camellia sinensis]|uniref:Bulb-type lectin domain-containing protein n=1 Tax=Camellia sinensis TaxID=4442 RepID=A0A7J7HCT9_CAMSI|nr:hypothetical protein HYC85_011671 [Camellia sinensis]
MTSAPDLTSCKSLEICSLNNVTNSILEPRCWLVLRETYKQEGVSEDTVLHGQSITASNTIVSAGNHISSNGNTSATLLVSGNLVLRDRTSGELLWQCFDYPSHTLLPGMMLGYSVINRKTWSLISWKSREDPGPGVFSLEFDPQGTPQFFIMKGPQKYRTSGGNFSCCRGLKLLINGICFGLNLASSAGFKKEEVEMYKCHTPNPGMTGCGPQGLTRKPNH